MLHQKLAHGAFFSYTIFDWFNKWWRVTNHRVVHNGVKICNQIMTNLYTQCDARLSPQFGFSR